MTTPKLSSGMARLPSKEMLDRNTTSVGYIMKAKAYHRTTPKPSSGGVRTAKQGLAKGQFNLGVSYVNGRGVRRDRSLAHVWFSVSAANGHERGVTARNELETRLTPAELMKARVIFRQCWKKPASCPE